MDERPLRVAFPTEACSLEALPEERVLPRWASFSGRATLVPEFLDDEEDDDVLDELF